MDSAPSAASCQPLPGALRILLVDDNLPLLQFLEMLLESHGHLPDIASSPLEAADMARHQLYDLLITDLLMSGMDGPQLLAAVRALPGHERLPVIFISGLAAEETLGLRALPATRYLRKPFTPTELVETLACLQQEVRSAALGG